MQVDGREVPIVDEEFSEEREFLDVRQGLGLVPFSIDVHCCQWGTLSRLLNAVDRGVVPEGWGIDEDTMLEISEQTLTVRGPGQAYRVRRSTESAQSVEIYKSGQTTSI